MTLFQVPPRSWWRHLPFWSLTGVRNPLSLPSLSCFFTLAGKSSLGRKTAFRICTSLSGEDNSRAVPIEFDKHSPLPSCWTLISLCTVPFFFKPVCFGCARKDTVIVLTRGSGFPSVTFYSELIVAIPADDIFFFEDEKCKQPFSDSPLGIGSPLENISQAPSRTPARHGTPGQDCLSLTDDDFSFVCLVFCKGLFYRLSCAEYGTGHSRVSAVLKAGARPPRRFRYGSAALSGLETFCPRFGIFPRSLLRGFLSPGCSVLSAFFFSSSRLFIPCGGFLLLMSHYTDYKPLCRSPLSVGSVLPRVAQGCFSSWFPVMIDDEKQLPSFRSKPSGTSINNPLSLFRPNPISTC